MLKDIELETVKKLIASFKPPITFYESKVLLPGVLGRLGYVIRMFNDFDRIAADKTVATHIDAALRNLLDPKVFELGVPEPKVGLQYLTKISEQIKTEFLRPLQALLERGKGSELLEDISKLSQYFTDVVNTLQTVVGTQENLFQYSFRTFLSIRNTATNEVTLGPPTEITLALMPFQTRLLELVKVSQTTIDSIKDWAEHIKRQKQDHVTMIVNLSQVKAAEQQANAAKVNMWFQIMVVVFTIILIIGSWRANQYLDKMELQNALDASKRAIEKCSETEKKLNFNLNNCKASGKSAAKDHLSKPNQIMKSDN